MSREIDIRQDKPSVSERDVEQSQRRTSDRSRETQRSFPRERPSKSASEWATLLEVGRFRTVNSDDLLKHVYRGNGAQMRADIRSLLSQGLMTKRTIWIKDSRAKCDVIVLTNAGKSAVREQETSTGQRFYSGFVKPAEVAHDTAIYRMYQREAEEIQGANGAIRRVVLDYELKQKVFSQLGKIPRDRNAEYVRRKALIALENGLAVVDGKILLPDLRIEYDSSDGSHRQVDLELATRDYRGSQLRGKSDANFKMYASADSIAHLSRVCDDHRIAADIFAL